MHQSHPGASKSAESGKNTPLLSGAAHLRGALQLVVLGWGFMLAQELLLFFRPTPYGGAYVEQWQRYFFFALLFNLLALLLVSLPVLPYWWWRSILSETCVSPSTLAGPPMIQGSLLTRAWRHPLASIHAQGAAQPRGPAYRAAGGAR